MSESAAVVVVGGGPSGLTAAAALATHGHSVVVVDPENDSGSGSRALAVHAGSLAVMDRIGCADEVIEAGRRLRGTRLRTNGSVLLEQSFDGLPGPHPFVLTIPQPTTEGLLRERCRVLGVGFVRDTVEGVTGQGEGVTLALASGAVVEAPFVVGADGHRSTVRDCVGIAFPDTGANAGDEELVGLADVGLSGPADPDFFSAYPGRRGLLVMIPLPNARFRVIGNIKEGQDISTPAALQALVDERGPGGLVVDDVAWSSQFRFSHHLADTFRAGRVLLTGDAGHVHSPVGGQGMNLGIRDGWYAAQAIDHAMRAGDLSALDAYAANRRATASSVISMTNRMARMIFAPPVIQPVRNRVLRVVNRTPAPRKQALRLSGLLDSGPSWAA